jgi:hypothetical protein
MWILWLGSEHCGKGLAKAVLPVLSFLVLWHLSQLLMWMSISASMPHHQYYEMIISLVLFLLSWPVMMSPWVSVIIFVLKFLAQWSLFFCFCLLCQNNLLHRIPESIKHESAIYRYVYVFFMELQNSSCSCANFNWCEKIPIASMAFGLRKSVGISLPFLYFITKLYFKKASVSLFLVLSCLLL